MTKTGVTHLIIHSFALAHALACLLLHDTGFGDTFVLTCLTIAMVVVLIRYFDGPVEVIVGLLLLASFAGFFLGTNGARWIQKMLPALPGIWSYVLTTTLVTEFLGWSIFFVVRRKKK
ncbi:MAG: hypothetical protein WC377_07310 [Bacteroidales bacterium]|jgi:uncharacterized protein (DUF697 family)|nr:hypothetical protein [Bacteroidales bacterium]MDD2824430.1 hypothetical protein [Bacteroidales bacterium]MDD3101258.1 hypothetical protein [Bacteroidales bacterium]MDD3639996.1 hypothetical protein [Bacteroidales bacterium]MDD3945046.1 hypothetical protein [Bacteroidales bacterium]